MVQRPCAPSTLGEVGIKDRNPSILTKGWEKWGAKSFTKGMARKQDKEAKTKVRKAKEKKRAKNIRKKEEKEQKKTKNPEKNGQGFLSKGKQICLIL